MKKAAKQRKSVSVLARLKAKREKRETKEAQKAGAAILDNKKETRLAVVPATIVIPSKSVEKTPAPTAPTPALKQKPLPVHPYANLLPRMTDAEFAALEENIVAVGRIIDPIVLLDGQIIDGRHRDLICCKTGIERRTVDFKASWGSPIEYVYSKACHRHMSDTQKACAAVGILEARLVETLPARLANLRNCKNAKSSGAQENPANSAQAVAGIFGVSPRYLALAKWLKTENQTAFEEALNGRTTLSRAQREVQRSQKREKLTKAEKPQLAGGASWWHIAEGDCVERLAELPRGKARLVIADPQYNIGYDYGKDGKGEKQDDARSASLYISTCLAWMSETRDVLTADGSFWLVISDEFAAELCCAARDLGYHRRAWIKWYETFGVNCSDNFNRTSRHLLYFTLDPKRFVFNKAAFNRPSARQVLYNDGRAKAGGKLWDDVWAIPRLVDNAKERLPDFPTQLPLDLIRPIVAGCSEPGDLVIDPFNGSGTTGHAALELKRKYWGCDIRADFIDLAKHRLRQQGHECASIDDVIEGRPLAGGK